MVDEAWRPLGAENDPNYEGLHDGIPSWLAPSFWAWVRGQFSRSSSGGRMVLLNTDLLHQAERVLRFTVGYEGVGLDTGVNHLRTAVIRRGWELKLADFLLSSQGLYAHPEEVRDMLEEAQSLWTVGTRAGKPGLIKRVADGVQVAAEATMRTAGHAGARLAEAWAAAFGFDPDPSKAYLLAVKAVEDAAIPVVLPNDQNATLGKVIARMRDLPYSFAVPRERGEVTSQAVLLSMLSLLWNGQGDRHGGLPDASVSISQADAEAAVLVAVPLVQLFASESVTRLS